MTQMRIDGDAVAALGRALSDHALALRGIEEIPGLGTGFVANAGPSCRGAVTDWTRRRTDLCATLDDLARLAQDAGRVYVEVERAVEDGLGGGGA